MWLPWRFTTAEQWTGRVFYKIPPQKNNKIRHLCDVYLIFLSEQKTDWHSSCAVPWERKEKDWKLSRKKRQTLWKGLTATKKINKVGFRSPGLVTTAPCLVSAATAGWRNSQNLSLKFPSSFSLSMSSSSSSALLLPFMASTLASSSGRLMPRPDTSSSESSVGG